MKDSKHIWKDSDVPFDSKCIKCGISYLTFLSLYSLYKELDDTCKISDEEFAVKDIIE